MQSRIAVIRLTFYITECTVEGCLFLELVLKRHGTSRGSIYIICVHFSARWSESALLCDN